MAKDSLAGASNVANQGVQGSAAQAKKNVKNFAAAPEFGGSQMGPQ